MLGCALCCPELRKGEAGELTVGLSNMEVTGDLEKSYFCVIVGMDVSSAVSRETTGTSGAQRVQKTLLDKFGRKGGGQMG